MIPCLGPMFMDCKVTLTHRQITRVHIYYLKSTLYIVDKNPSNIIALALTQINIPWNMLLFLFLWLKVSKYNYV
jgi:hypothetical protein